MFLKQKMKQVLNEHASWHSGCGLKSHEYLGCVRCIVLEKSDAELTVDIYLEKL